MNNAIYHLRRMLAVYQLSPNNQLAEQCDGWLCVNPIDAPEVIPAGSTQQTQGGKTGAKPTLCSRERF